MQTQRTGISERWQAALVAAFCAEFGVALSADKIERLQSVIEKPRPTRRHRSFVGRKAVAKSQQLAQELSA